MTFGDNYHHFSHIEPFAFKRPCALLPYCYGAGQQDSSGYSLAKEGWTLTTPSMYCRQWSVSDRTGYPSRSDHHRQIVPSHAVTWNVNVDLINADKTGR